MNSQRFSNTELQTSTSVAIEGRPDSHCMPLAATPMEALLALTQVLQLTNLRPTNANKLNRHPENTTPSQPAKST